MKKLISQIALPGLVALALVTVPGAGHAQDNTNNITNNSTPASAPVIKQKVRAAFGGKITAVDTAAMTLTVGTQTINVTSETIIMRNGKRATLSDILVGDMAVGGFKKDDAGKLNATSIRVMVKPKNEKKKAEDDAGTPAPAPGN
jgi:hypothetical protein